MKNWTSLPLPDVMLRVNALRRERERLEAQDQEYRRQLAIQQKSERQRRTQIAEEYNRRAAKANMAKLKSEKEACTKWNGGPCTMEDWQRFDGARLNNF